MVSISPRLRDSLDYEEPEATDPRFSPAFRSLSLESDYDEHDIHDDRRPFSGVFDPSASRRRRRQRKSDLALDHAMPFQYRTVADGDAFRLAVVLPGTGTAPVECQLIWESAKQPQRDYLCLSYCWQTLNRDAAILCDGYRFRVTKNLLCALQSLRRPTTNLLIWCDQLCINQDDHEERGHQVSIMKQIFGRAKEVIVWLGEEDDRSKKLCEYARKMRRGDENSKSALNRILTQRQLQDALQKLLQRPWFSRVWVLPEVALARFTTVACGRSILSWDNLVRLIRDVQLPQLAGFDKQTDLLGNPRQRIAIITQMSASQRQGLLHTDITQLLILAKASKATDVRDMIYAFYGMTLLTTFPDYTRSVERLYADIAWMYVNSILWEDYYSRWHGLSEVQRTQQLMSILYSAGTLHQHCNLPSWVPDWTFNWHLAPIWCRTTSNITTGTSKDEWSTGIRCDFRAGGDKLDTFEVIEDQDGSHRLRLSVHIFAAIASVSENPPTSPIDTTAGVERVSSTDGVGLANTPTLRYGRTFFQTECGLVGIATPGVKAGDALAILSGGDVPVVLRRCADRSVTDQTFKLLCECFVDSTTVMNGEMFRASDIVTEDIVLI